MSKFTFVGKNKKIPVGGGGSTNPISYDTRWGTATDSKGWITFGLKSGCRRVWVNGGRPNDSGDGLTPATAKKTLDAAKTVWLDFGSYNPGDQLMIAEGYSYVDGGGTWWRDNTGYSAAYPLLATSYDPADATNPAKYGRAVGAAMPKVAPPTDGSIGLFAAGGDTGSNYYAVQGIAFELPLDVSTAGYGFVGKHDGVIFQNCRFQNVNVSINSNGGTRAVGALFSKCSFYGMWSNVSNTLAMFIAGYDGAYFQDIVFYHCGWKIGASRDEVNTSGGTTFFQHDCYYHASNINGRFDRCVHIDCANDGLNIRGGAAATQAVAWDVPIAFTMGGWSSSYTEAPTGVLTTLDDGLIVGGARINNTLARNWGLQISNNIAGSYASNVVAFDSPYRSDSQATIVYHSGVNPDISQNFTVDKWRSYQYADHLTDGSDSSTYHLVYSNSYLDSITNTGTPPTSYANQTLSSTVVHSGATTYPSKITREQFVTAVLTGLGVTPGFDYEAKKKQLVDLMIYRPDVLWAPLMHGIGLPAYGASSSFASTTFPDFSNLTAPSVYTSPLEYHNPNMGTAYDPATGWITFGLKSGCRRIWVDNVNGNDSNNGLTAATAKASFTEAAKLWLDISNGWNPGDQLMIAESTVKYTDPGATQFPGGGTVWWTQRGGFSAQYPTAVLSYDPADASNSAKYGRASGATMPIINYTGNDSDVVVLAATSYFGGTDSYLSSNYAVQGIGYYRDARLGGGRTQSFSGIRQNIVYQNMRITVPSIGIQGSSLDTTTGITNVLFSKMSVCDGPTSGFYIENGQNMWFEDIVFYHCGWEIGATRNNKAIYFDHDCYLHAGNNNVNLSRCVHIDSANDALNARSNAVLKQAIVWDAPIALTCGGFSASGDEAPTGVTIRIDDVAVVGGGIINDSLYRNWLFMVENTLQGSYAKNICAFDSPYVTSGCLIYENNSASHLSDIYFTIENLRMYNFSTYDYELGGQPTGGATRHITLKNSLVDTFDNKDATAPSITLVNTALHSGATSYPNAVTRLQFATNVATKMGLSTTGTYLQIKERIVNMLLFRPDISWAPMLIAETLPKFGLVPIYETRYLPNVSAVTAAQVFKNEPTDVTAPTLSSPTGVKTGTTTATVTASTNEANGMFFVIVTTNATPPPANEVRYGRDNSGAYAPFKAYPVVTATGVQTVNVTGLTSGTTYYAHFMHMDAAFNNSNVVTSASFTTD